jgi:hypothetical protein
LRFGAFGHGALPGITFCMEAADVLAAGLYPLCVEVSEHEQEPVARRWATAFAREFMRLGVSTERDLLVDLGYETYPSAGTRNPRDVAREMIAAGNQEVDHADGTSTAAGRGLGPRNAHRTRLA